MNSLLNLYDSYLKLCFAVLKKHVVSSNVDSFYKQNGYEIMLRELWIEVSNFSTEHGVSLPSVKEAFPVPVVSLLTEDSYNQIQHVFGVLKDVANSVGGVLHNMPTDVQKMLDLAKRVQSGDTLDTSVLLSESTITNYDLDRSQFKVNETVVAFRGMVQSDFFNKIMFSFPKNTEVSWEQMNEEISERFGNGDKFSSWDSMRQAMYRANQHIKNTVGTEDNFYTQKKKVITRQFGPDVD